ncbi:spore cortex biosynthesis protein YabQ [Pullulanibacillus sp. KACC 23026]|uniref:spore cortex biosynthesis protein YabQ n=1 Tax=Pullulanibacillus sp. KACC 23026 TaxID=3028315 RepID=UPI0023AE80EE|nr:spore cortex biosynthesis protein YabQ [Pullulanibacillus sp. KACC 23026]WEG12720.1 spore cortex biosynthesis protein YabQ [Pullulanibacillus sp. KACC 23026]
MTLTEQFYSMLAMCGMGIWLGASLTTYHRFFPQRKVWQWLLFVTDLLFWCLQGLIIFYVLLLVNQGVLRFYLFIALLIGFSAYKGLFETTYYKILDTLIHFIVGTARFLRKMVKLFLVQPLLFLLKLLFSLVKMISRMLLAILLFIGTVIYTPLKWLFGLIIPKTWIQKGVAFLTKMKTILSKLFKKWR